MLKIRADSIVLLSFTNCIDNAAFPAGAAEGAVIIGVRIGPGRYGQGQICNQAAETAADTLFCDQVLGQAECTQPRYEGSMALRPVTDIRRLAPFRPGGIPNHRKSRIYRRNGNLTPCFTQQFCQIHGSTIQKSLTLSAAMEPDIRGPAQITAVAVPNSFGKGRKKDITDTAPGSHSSGRRRVGP